jgi:mono/diheme cytochrome c family protein
MTPKLASSWAVALALATALAGGCVRPQKTAAQRGAGTFARMCAGCHGANGREGARITAYRPPPRDLGDPKLFAILSEDQMRDVIRNGKGYMPPIGRVFSAAELDDLLAFLHTLPKPSQAAAITSAPNTKIK